MGEPKRRRFFRGIFHRNSQRASESLSVAPEIEVAPAKQPRAGTMFEPRSDIDRENLAPRSQSMQIGPVTGAADEPLTRQEFLFYGGTEHEQHYKPASSGAPEIDYKKIKPALNKRMPVFFTPPVPNQTLRPSMVVVDTREYEF